LDEQLVVLEKTLQGEGQKIPNATHPDVPLGGEENAGLRKEVSIITTCDTPPPRNPKGTKSPTRSSKFASPSRFDLTVPTFIFSTFVGLSEV